MKFSAPGTIKQGMRSVKDSIDRHQHKGVYKIDCSCGKSYIGETGRSLQTRLKEHMELILEMKDPILQPWQNTPQKLNTMYVWKTPQLSQGKNNIIGDRLEKLLKLSNICVI